LESKDGWNVSTTRRVPGADEFVYFGDP
jgi:hypothetical protein